MAMKVNKKVFLDCIQLKVLLEPVLRDKGIDLIDLDFGEFQPQAVTGAVDEPKAIPALVLDVKEQF